MAKDTPIIKGRTLVEGSFEVNSVSSTPNIDIKPFRLYKFRFYGVGFKKIPLNIYRDQKTGKRFIMSGKPHLVGTYIDIMFFALEEMSPLAVIVGVLAGVAGLLGLTLIVLKKVEDMSLILLPLAFVPIAIIYRKEIKKQLAKL